MKGKPTGQTTSEATWRVPKLWPGATVACLGGGPSLTQADVDQCRYRWRVIAINDAYRLAPWADLLYACDGAWWTWHNGVPGFEGIKVSGTPSRGKWPAVRYVTLDGVQGLSDEPGVLHHGRNSGYQAINLAVQLGAVQIVLLGYDMQADPVTGRQHWFGDHPSKVPPPYDAFLREYPSLIEPLAERGVVVVNCSRRTALECFPRATLESMLRPESVACGGHQPWWRAMSTPTGG